MRFQAGDGADGVAKLPWASSSPMSTCVARHGRRGDANSRSVWLRSRKMARSLGCGVCARDGGHRDGILPRQRAQYRGAVVGRTSARGSVVIRCAVSSVVVLSQVQRRMRENVTAADRVASKLELSCAALRTGPRAEVAETGRSASNREPARVDRAYAPANHQRSCTESGNLVTPAGWQLFSWSLTSRGARCARRASSHHQVLLGRRVRHGEHYGRSMEAWADKHLM